MRVLWRKTDFGNMHYRRLGKTGLNVSAIGLGGWALGGGYDWGTICAQEVAQTVHAALDSGINIIDTAPIYGTSEDALGRVLQGKRERVFLSTKCGLVKNGSWTDHDLRAPTIINQLENSLRRLRTDYIDIYWIHYLDPRVPWQEALNTLAGLQAQGKIRHIGVCNVPAEILVQLAQTGLVSCVQDELSLLHTHKAQALLQLCQTYQLGFMAY
ncbi:MAG: aldo/keto reductase, partial [Elusimicrobiaceae bacterium]|nr:aldo/keto reductase [Elusimicrobiaceae bacterium]